MNHILKCTLVIALTFLAVVPVRSGTNSDPTYKRIFVLKTKDMARALEYLTANDYDVAGVNVREGLIHVIDSQIPLPLLQDTSGAPLIEVKSATPYQEGLLDERYHNADEVEAELLEISNQNPQLSQRISIGKSLEGRDIWALKISDNVQTDDPTEPKLLFNGMHHAREVMTPEVVLDIAHQLTKNYGKDADVTAWVNENEIWVVPMVNPDGNHKVWSEDNWWRKNTRDGHGVDLNRNYPFGWNACGGSSGSRWSDTYRGPTPASEPETQVMMSLVEKVRPVFDISFHSYSELVLHPFGCPGNSGTDPAFQTMKKIGQELSAVLPLDHYNGNYTAGEIWNTIYKADGGDIDWMYGQYQVIPYVIEINSATEGFQPDYDLWRDRTVEKMRAAWKLLLTRAGASGVRGVVAADLMDPKDVVSVELTDGNGQVQRRSLDVDRAFHFVTEPGSYLLSVRKASGAVLFNDQVEIGQTLLKKEISLSKN